MIAWKETIPPIPEYGIEIGITEYIDDSENSESDDISNKNDKKEDNDAEIEDEIKNELNNELVEDESIQSGDNVFEKENLDEDDLEDFNDTPIDKIETIKKEVEDIEKENVEKKTTDEKLSSKKVIDSRSIYSEKSNSPTGASLDLQGWMWDSLPEPKDLSKENGKIIFEIFVNIYGEIENIRTLETTVTPSVEKVYKDEVLNLSFTPTSTNYNPADISKGTITFIIKSK
tara:strand:- start:439 stop:1128 length:690 start_codon:yes stop_codon:yes gene_type:complete